MNFSKNRFPFLLNLALFSVISLSACNSDPSASVEQIPNTGDTPSADGTNSVGTTIPGSSSSTGSPSGPAAAAIPFRSNPQNLSAVWANDGGDKVTRNETRASNNIASAENSIWKNSKVNLFGAKNEVVAFNLILEAKQNSAQAVTVTLDHLDGPGGARIGSTPTSGDNLFNYNQRDIELFYVKYLKILGLSKFGYDQYDERHIPKGLQRPQSSPGVGTGTWANRPNHDQEYPDIAVPIEANPSFDIAKGQNQSIWADIYIPKEATPGVYQGAVTISEAGKESYLVPVELTVRNFSLPDVPSSKTMLYFGTTDISTRYLGTGSPSNASDVAKLRLIRDRHFQLAHRHKISLIDSNYGTSSGPDAPSVEWMPRLDGTLFSSAQGYRGPGADTGNNIFSVGTYGSWGWQSQGASGMVSHANAWTSWFGKNAPTTDYFLYLIDESQNYPQIQTWASQLEGANKTPQGRNLASFVTTSLPSAINSAPSLQIITSTMSVGDTNTWNNAYANLRTNSSKKFYMYNGKHPASGSFMTDDDGVALRELPWGQYKKGIDRWFYWESTYYNDFQGGTGQTNVFKTAQTFGGPSRADSISGQTAGNYSNGDGVLFYPGTDKVYSAESFGLNGPIASLRLKHWRRGIQDVDYLTLAQQKDPAKTQAIVNSMVKSVLWENGVDNVNDPSYKKCDLGWSTNPDTWEAARAQLANIIEGK